MKASIKKLTEAQKIELVKTTIADHMAAVEGASKEDRDFYMEFIKDELTAMGLGAYL